MGQDKIAAPAVDAAELGKLKALAEAATQGEWTYFPKPKYKEYHVSVPLEGRGFKLALFSDGCKTERPEQDAKFIAAANPAAILRITALVAQLEDENDRLRMALADKAMAQTMLHELCVKDGGINMRYSGGAAQLLAEAFGEQFEKSGATNYLEVGFNTSNGVRLLVTLQRCDGKTPATLKTEAEATVAQQAARIAELERGRQLDRDVMKAALVDLYQRMEASYDAEPTRRITFMDMEAAHEHVARLGFGGSLDAAMKEGK